VHCFRSSVHSSDPDLFLTPSCTHWAPGVGDPERRGCRMMHGSAGGAGPERRPMATRTPRGRSSGPVRRPGRGPSGRPRTSRRAGLGCRVKVFQEGRVGVVVDDCCHHPQRGRAEQDPLVVVGAGLTLTAGERVDSRHDGGGDDTAQVVQGHRCVFDNAVQPGCSPVEGRPPRRT